MRSAAIVGALVLGAALGASPAAAAPAIPAYPVCTPVTPAPGAPYYAIKLVATGRVPGTRRARGEAQVTFARSPFGLAVSPDGRYVYDLRVEFSGLAALDGDYAVWVARADLSEIRAAGTLDESSVVASRVEWNKFLVVVTLEARDTPLGDTWQGPIVFRGMSRSGRMHTMAGHGPFQAEPCSKYGY